MDDELYVMKYSIFFSCFWTFIVAVFIECGFTDISSSFFTSVPQEELITFVRMAIYLAITFGLFYISAWISYGILFLFYRVLLRFIYSKPYRVYSAGEPKEYKLFSLR